MFKFIEGRVTPEELCWSVKTFSLIWIYCSPLSSKLKKKNENLGQRVSVAPLMSVLPERYIRVARAEVSDALRCCEHCPSGDLCIRPAPSVAINCRSGVAFCAIPLQDIVLNELLPHRRILSILLRIARFWYRTHSYVSPTASRRRVKWIAATQKNFINFIEDCKILIHNTQLCIVHLGLMCLLLLSITHCNLQICSFYCCTSAPSIASLSIHSDTVLYKLSANSI